jgi:hypothetical protein
MPLMTAAPAADEHQRECAEEFRDSFVHDGFPPV